MKVPRGLTPNDLVTLSEWYESDDYKVFKKVLTIRGGTHSTSALAAQELSSLNHIQGAAAELIYLNSFFKQVNKDERAKEEKAKKAD